MRHSLRTALLLSACLFFLYTRLQAQGCDCTNCPQFMPDLFTGSFPISVQGADNPTLGQNGQGVCGVNIHFDHTAICDISITLTSPSGQSITLVGPIGQFCTNMGNTGTDWNISFLPCSDPNVMPDPGFAAQWNSNQPWGGNNNYTGSYYPYAGCLQNFTGPVNGTWTLNVVDGQANDVGNLYDYEIIFCDGSGIECTSCEAAAGTLPQPDVSACEGSAELVLDLPPAYLPPPNPQAPPASDYSYTYIIAGVGGVVQAYDPTPDLTALAPGNYTVCGLSYLSADESDIPAPNGTLTIAQLSGNTAPFCGDVTPNCVGVTVLPGPPNEQVFETICAPGCFDFHGSDYCATGVYTITDYDANGCAYDATLHLTVIPPVLKTIFETVCAGACALTPGFDNACSAGQYSQIFPRANGCDSIVTLNLNVIPIQVNIVPPTIPACAGDTITLLGAGSTNGAGTFYQWTAYPGAHLVGPTANINAAADAPGDYQLRVCRQVGNKICCDSAAATVLPGQMPPGAVTPQGTTSLCAGLTATYSVPPASGATAYQWQIPAGAILVSGQTTSSITVQWPAAPGGQVCVRAVNACGPGPQTCLAVAVIPQPVAQAGLDRDTCGRALLLHATADSLSGSLGHWVQISGPDTLRFTQDSLPTSGISADEFGRYTLQWMEDNALCTAADTVVVRFNASPAAGAPAFACDGTGNTYTVTFPISGGAGPYWVMGDTVAAGAPFTSPPLANGAAFSFAIADTNGCVSPPVTGTYNCLCLTQATTMSGALLEACAGDSVSAAAPTSPVLDGNDVAAFVLHTLSGNALGTVFGENTSGRFGFQPGMAYDTVYFISYVVGNNLNGLPDPADPCLSVAPGQPVIFHQNPVANAGLDRDTCGLALTLTGGGMGLGTWTLAGAPAGGSLSFSNAQSAATTATATLFGGYAAIWSLTHQGCSATDTVALTFNEPPATGPVLTDCDAANQNFTLSFSISGGLAPYSVNGAAVAGSVFTSALLPNGSAYAFTVTDANGCAAPVVTGAYSCNCATAAGQMSGQSLTACEGASVQATHAGGAILDGNDVAAYVLQDLPGTALGQVFGENTTGIFTFQPGMAYGTTYYISFVVGNDLNGLPDPADPCRAVAPGQPVIFYQNPVADAGMDTALCGLALSLNAVPPGGSGTWSVSAQPGGATVLFGDDQSPTVGVTASLPGTYSFLWTVQENGCFGNDLVQVQLNDAPTLADLVRDCDATGENYTVTLTLSGGAMPYVVNGQVFSGQVFNANPIPNNQPYAFTVTDANGCAMPDISGSFNCNCLTDAGSMSAATLTACEGQTVSAQTLAGPNLDANDVAAYVLHSGSGPVLGQVFGQNTTGVFSLQPGMAYGVTYYVSRMVGNDLNGAPDLDDPCLAIAPGQPVVFLQNPAPQAGEDAMVCGGSSSLTGVSSGFTGGWIQVGGPGSAAFADAADPLSAVMVDVFGTYFFERREDNSGCAAADTVTVTFHELPATANLVETCNGTNTEYVVTFGINGGTAPYAVSGLAGTFAGSAFTSSPLTNNAAYSFQVTDANGCLSPALSGSHQCACATDAGGMVTTPTVFCAGDSATAIWDGSSALLDTDDGLQFILHDQAGATLGTIFATANQPAFPFEAPLQTGVTYYISAVAGNHMGGQIDLTDPCLSVTPGAPIQWKPLPTATLLGDATLCQGQSATLLFSGAGAFPLTVTYSDGITSNTLTLAGSQPLALSVQPSTTTTYTLIAVSDGTLPTCASPLSAAVALTVNAPVNAGQALPALTFCAGKDTLIPLASLLVGAQAGGGWEEVSVAPTPPGAFNAAAATLQTALLPPGTYRFAYQLAAAAPCPGDSALGTIVIAPLPGADAGPDLTLTCGQTTATLGGPNTSTGAGLTYAWVLDGQPAGHARQLDVAAPGTYLLTVRNAAGCLATDAVSVGIDTLLPFATFQVEALRCFGDNRGAIALDSLVSAHPPVLFSLNGGPFSAQSSFEGLGPGAYVVTLQNAAGCEWASDTLRLTAPPALAVDLGEDIEVLLGDSAHLNAVVTPPTANIQMLTWQPLLDSLHAGALEQHFFPLRSRQVTLTLTDVNGCTATTNVLVRVNHRRNVFIPNAFQPGSDLNGRLTVFGGRDVAAVEVFQVYDRWGELLFDAAPLVFNDPAQGWDGTWRGNDAAPGVYIYYAVVRFIDGETEIYRGDVTVLR